MLHWCFLFAVLLKQSETHNENTEGISCKDDNNMPVDWWYILKMPSGAGPHMESGGNFTYVLPETSGRWMPSFRHLDDDDSMLQHTLIDLYFPQSDHAALVYGENKGNPNIHTAANGILMANKYGGLWLIHTIPGFPDLGDLRVKIPDDQRATGHLMMCMNLPLTDLNTIADVIEHIQARVLRLNMASELIQYLPKWGQIPEPNSSSLPTMTTKSMTLVTRLQSLRGIILYRRPGEERCIYQTFAHALGLMLDVYGHYHQTICTDDFGIRSIDTISVNLPNQVVYYLDNKTSSFEFAVSTAASWQKRTKTNNGTYSYWSCFSNLEGSNIGKGGIVMCVNKYNLWLTFDNLKVREPECPIPDMQLSVL